MSMFLWLKYINSILQMSKFVTKCVIYKYYQMGNICAEINPCPHIQVPATQRIFTLPDLLAEGKTNEINQSNNTKTKHFEALRSTKESLEALENGQAPQIEWVKIGDSTYELKCGDKISGRFTGKMDKTEGEGVFTSDKLCFEGSWKDGMPYSGILKYSQGTEIALKSPNQGRIEWKNGRSYEGGLKNLKPHGSGNMHMENGDSYKGLFQDGYFHGKGIYTYKNEIYFNGSYDKGQRLQGFLVDPNTSTRIPWQNGHGVFSRPPSIGSYLVTTPKRNSKNLTNIEQILETQPNQNQPELNRSQQN